MGLDAVAFVFALEEAFGIAIPDADAERLLSPGSVVDYLERRLHPGTLTGCLEQRAFYRLRRAAMRVLDRPRSAFAPSTPWADVLQPQRHNRQWKLIGNAVAITPWPALKPLFTFGPTKQSVGATAATLATTGPAALMRPNEGWQRPAIEGVVRRVMAEELGITAFNWSNHFKRDLGVH
jgi:hypothetical protein